MSGPWIVAFLGLCCIVAALAVLVLGLLARIDRALSGGYSDASISDSHDFRPDGPAVDDSVDIGDFHASPIRASGTPTTILLFAAEGCLPCELLIEDLGRHPVQTPAGMRQVLVWTGMDAPEELPGWEIVTAEAERLRRDLDISSTPYGLVVGDDRRVRAVGVPNKARDVDRLITRSAEHAHAVQA